MYAGASAAYLLCYKDVWEHHYVLLLPPLVLMCLRGVNPWVWAPAYAVAALPWLFPLYDLPNLGYNEDPQRYWLPSVSLLHHAFKPLAALWLLLAVVVISLRKGTGLTAESLRTLSPAEREREGEPSGELAGTSARGGSSYRVPSGRRNTHYADDALRNTQYEAVPHCLNARMPECLNADPHPVPTPSGSLFRDFALSRFRVLSPGSCWVRWWGWGCVAALLAVGVVSAGSWAAAAVKAQRAVSRRLVWGPELMQPQATREGCGPAALAAVCRYYGISATEAELAKLAGTTPRGTAMLGLLKAARAKGLAAEGRKYTVETLAAAPRPCILFFHAGHFAVLTGVRGHRFYLADPSLGARIFTPAQLRHTWHGETLLLGPTSGGG